MFKISLDFIKFSLQTKTLSPKSGDEGSVSY